MNMKIHATRSTQIDKSRGQSSSFAKTMDILNLLSSAVNSIIMQSYFTQSILLISENGSVYFIILIYTKRLQSGQVLRNALQVQNSCKFKKKLKKYKTLLMKIDSKWSKTPRSKRWQKHFERSRVFENLFGLENINFFQIFIFFFKIASKFKQKKYKKLLMQIDSKWSKLLRNKSQQSFFEKQGI